MLILRACICKIPQVYGLAVIHKFDFDHEPFDQLKLLNEGSLVCMHASFAHTVTIFVIDVLASQALGL